MSLARFNSASFSVASGVSVASLSIVEVRREVDGGLASLFSDIAGAVAISNPMTADAQGRFDFCVAASSQGFRVKVTKGSEEFTLRNVPIGLAQYSDGIVDGRSVSAEDIGAVGDGVTDTTAAFNAALALGKRIWLRSGETYKVTSSLLFPANGAGLLGDGTPTIYAPAASFSNTDLATNFTSTSCVIHITGMNGAPWTERRDIVLDGFILRSEVSDGRKVDAIVARNVTNLKIKNCEIFGFPVGCGIRLDSILGRWEISDNYIHTFTTNAAWGTQPQITGVVTDGDRVNGIESVGGFIRNNRIFNLTIGAVPLATYGYQSDGINIGFSENITVTGNTILNVGEGIDHFGRWSVIADNTVDNAYIFGIKLIHGASYNTVVGNTVRKAGLGGISISGSNTADQDVKGNTIVGNTITNIDPDAVWASPTTACIRTIGTGETYKIRSNYIADNVLDPGTVGDWAIYRGSDGTLNDYVDNKIVAAGTLGSISTAVGGETGLVSSPGNVSVVDAAADTTMFPMLAGSATGDLPAMTDSGLAYNASTNQLTITGGYVGPKSGTTTNDAAAAGDVGELISNTLAVGSATALTTGVAKTITSISLTAGDWDVWGNLWITGNGATTVLLARASISATTDTIDGTLDRLSATYFNNALIFGSANYNVNTGPTRVSLASTTTYYLTADAGFGVSTCSGYGTIQGRRVR